MDQILSLLNQEIFKLGNKVFTTSSLVVLILSFTFLFWFSAWVRKLLAKRIFPRYNLDVGAAEAFATIVRYVLVVIGLMVILQTTGIELSALGILFGALGIGIGFGLQNITNNFISGIIILFERPVKVGDRIEVGNVAGNIVNISARATTIITNDNIAIIVPNSEFINSRVINWSYQDNRVRFNILVGVSYSEDPAQVREILLDVAMNCEGVLKNPAPDVLFDEFADSSLVFNLRVWTTDYSAQPRVLKSILYYEVFEKFRQHGIKIPFPQRDLHIKSGRLE
jgi:small-conductance mechanosensitive channel